MGIGLLNWWVERMREILPAPFRSGARPGLVVVQETVPPGMVTLVAQGWRRRRPLGRYSLGDQALREAASRVARRHRQAAVLECPAELMLECIVDLPAVPDRDLHGLLGSEMDRLTPFRRCDVLWSGAVHRKLGMQGSRIRLAIVPRAQADPILSALRAAGIAIDRIVSKDVRGQARMIALSRSRSHKTRLVDAATLVLCGSLAVMAAGTPFALQAQANAALDVRAHALRPLVAELEALRAEVAARLEAVDAITRSYAQLSSRLQSLALLSQALPDDTYLTTLTLHGLNLTIGGRSTDAARLLLALPQHSSLQMPAFIGPITRDETSGTELFSLHIQLSP